MNRVLLKYSKRGKIKFTIIVLSIIILSCTFISCSEKKVSLVQREYLTPDVLCGTVTFSDGCSPKLDTLISFGIALLHHMTYEDAAYTFDKVIESDKDCFWGHWGKAMTLVHPLWPDIPDKNDLDEGYILTQNALKLAKTKKEKLYGSAIAAFFKDGLNKTEPERLAAFNDGWQIASKELPEDLEANLFSVLSALAIASPTDKSYKIQREAGAKAEKALNVIPDHPGAFHYAIHAYDFPPLASNAIRVAKDYYKLAPEIPHALHMPTHIFTRLGYWQESIDLNLRSASAAQKIPGPVTGHYFHALDYLVYAYLQKSELKKAEEIASILDTISGAIEPAPQTAYSIAAIPGRIALETRDWERASKLTLPSKNFPWKKFPQYEALVYFAKGIGAGRNGDTETAQKSIQKLEELNNTFENTEANKYWINQIEIQKIAVNAWFLFAKDETDKALEEMKAAAELENATEKNPVTPGQLLPAREMLGDMLLEMNRPEEALQQYELSLQSNPNRFNSLYGAGKAAELSGDYKKANSFYSALLKTSNHSSVNRQQLVHAKNVIDSRI